MFTPLEFYIVTFCFVKLLSFSEVFPQKIVPFCKKEKKDQVHKFTHCLLFQSMMKISVSLRFRFRDYLQISILKATLIYIFLKVSIGSSFFQSIGYTYDCRLEYEKIFLRNVQVFSISRRLFFTQIAKM